MVAPKADPGASGAPVPPQGSTPDVGPVPPVAPQAPQSAPGAAEDARSPAELARRAGASDSMVRAVARISRRSPGAGATAGFVASVYGGYIRHRGAILAGGLAFFATLSLVPALLTAGALAAVFFDPVALAEGIEELLANQQELLETIGPALDQVRSMATVSPSGAGMQGLISALLFLYAASRFVYVVRQVVDTTLGLEVQPPSLLSRGVALLVTVLTQLAVAVLVLALGVLPRLLDTLRIGEEVTLAIRTFRLPLGILAAYLLLTVMMRFGGSTRRVVGWVNLGALVGALIVIVGSAGLSWYLSVSTTYATIIATLGGVIALEIWLFIVGTAIVFSAEVEGVRLGTPA